ncbi:MAG: hypothetical protein ACE366_26060 [Bradymonadia bacterium]
MTLLVAPASHAGDGRIEWRTVDTAHFQVHYPAHLEALAMRAARMCEEAHRVLSPTLAYTPEQRTQVLLSDFGDGANGFANAQPYLLISLFAAPPAMDGNLNEFDDWLRQLVYHEYVHVLHLDTITGWPKFLNGFFGKQYGPNQNMPRFLVEGLAVYLESATSGFGRIHSATFKGYLRAQALAGKLFDLDEVVHVPFDWPGANVWYLYGGHFIDWVAHNRSPEGLTRMNYAISDDMIPYAMNRGAKAAMGSTLEEMWQAWRGDLTAEARVTEARLEAEGGVTRPRRITTLGRRHDQPRFLPDGRLLSLESDGHNPRGIIDLGVEAETDVEGEIYVRTDVTDNFDVCGDGETLVIDQSERHDAAYSWFDLYVWHNPTAQLRRLTRGARIREPACAPSSRWVAAVQVIAGRTRLVRVDLASGALTVLYDPGGLDQVAFPTISPDDHTVVVTRISQRHGRDLIAVDARTGALKTLTEDGAMELHPRFSPDGEWLIYVSDRTGIFDVYAHHMTEGTTARLTRLVTGALSPVVSPDGQRLVFQLITAGGFDLAEVPFTPQQPLSLGLATRRPPPMRAELSPDPLPHRPYDFTETFWPVTWTPSFSITNLAEAGSQAGLSAIANDIGNQHLLVLDVNTTPSEEAYSLTGFYLYQRWRLNMSADIQHSTSTLAQGAFYDGVTQPFQQERTALGGNLTLPTARTGHSLGMSLRYSATMLSAGRNTPPTFDAYDTPPRIPGDRVLAGVALSLNYRDAEGWQESLNAEEGQSAALTLRLRDPFLGSDDEVSELAFRYTRNQALWWRHVLVGRLDGGVGRNRRYGLAPAPERNLLTDQLDEISFTNDRFFRGYPANTVTGDRFLLLRLSYRAPVVDVFKGFSAVPFFFQRLKIAVFTDAAQASNEALEARWGAWRKTVGAELISESTIAWRQPFNIRVGWARGLDEGGESQLYFFLGNWF